jgi:hypothetical protein
MDEAGLLGDRRSRVEGYLDAAGSNRDKRCSQRAHQARLAKLTRMRPSHPIPSCCVTVLLPNR